MRSSQDFSLTPHFVSSHSYSTLHPKIATVRAAQVVLIIITGILRVHRLPNVVVALFGLVGQMVVFWGARGIIVEPLASAASAV